MKITKSDMAKIIVHNNPNFKVVEFDHFIMQVGLPNYVMSLSERIEKTNAIGLQGKKVQIKVIPLATLCCTFKQTIEQIQTNCSIDSVPATCPLTHLANGVAKRLSEKGFMMIS